jgi:hypothetical protein
VNRPVLDFESFMNMKGCTTGTHSNEKQSEITSLGRPAPAPGLAPNVAPPPASSIKSADTSSTGQETFGGPSRPVGIPVGALLTPRSGTPKPVEEDEDDVDVPVEVGTKCKRNGCNKTFVSQEESRTGDGEESVCVYHPSPPIFREGSKGYLCCKRRVLEFEEFLKIAGCKTGKHVFVKKKKAEDLPSTSEEFVKCRMDHYQTPTQVHASVYAKQADKQRSQVQFETDKVHLDIYLPASKRFKYTIHLYGPISAAASKYQILGTKIELTLVKQDSRSWSVLERDDADILDGQGFNLTFGVGGRTGTTGAKDLVLDGNNTVTHSDT